MNYDFEIIFKKLDEHKSTSGSKVDVGEVVSQDLSKEIDEISELRKIVLETTEAEINSYTTA